MEKATPIVSAEPLADAAARHEVLRDKVTIAMVGLIASLALLAWFAS